MVPPKSMNEPLSSGGMAAGRVGREWAERKAGSGMEPGRGCRHPRRRRAPIRELGRIDVGHGLHDRERVLRVLGGLAVELAAVGLVVLLADRQRPYRRV